MATSFSSMVLMYLINLQLGGIICVKMPFVPNGMISGMSHRGLNGDDM
tara:strand:+ start:507 stop:650 length:144 start_codon:yes stop_codon:yes gene_type:complete